MNNLAKAFGKNIKKVRESKGLSQGDIARLLKLHRSYVSGIERGVRNPSLGVVERFAKVLKVPVNNLVNLK